MLVGYIIISIIFAGFYIGVFIHINRTHIFRVLTMISAAFTFVTAAVHFLLIIFPPSKTMDIWVMNPLWPFISVLIHGFFWQYFKRHD